MVKVETEGQQLLLAVHAHLRAELAQLQDVVGQVRAGSAAAGAARSHLNAMAMRQNFWTMGAFCASYCRLVSTHHAIEDARLFPDLQDADAGLGPVLDRLATEHIVIAGLLDEVDGALVAVVTDESRLDEVESAVSRLADSLLAHLADEEARLLAPIGRLGIVV